jgi:tetratricopeptide (TPR) repeat protein
MKKHLSLLFLFFCPFVKGQVNKIHLDSLWSIYNNVALPDTSRLRAVEDIAWCYIGDRPDSSIVMAERELQLAREKKQMKYESNAYNALGASYLSKGDFPRALEYFISTLKIRQEIGDKRGIGGCYNNIGNIYESQSDYPKALEYYLKSLKIAEELNDKKGIASCYVNIGGIYKDQSDIAKAREYQEKALKIWEEVGDKQKIGQCFNNIGFMYEKQSDYSMALRYYSSALKMMLETDDKQGAGTCFENIGNIWSLQSHYKEALSNFLKAIKISKESADKETLGLCYNSLEDLYNNLGDYKTAIQYGDSGLHINKETGDINEERESYRLLSVTYGKSGQFKNAYENHVLYAELNDSIFNTDKNKQLGDAKTHFEVEKRETELKAQSAAQQAISLEEKKSQQLIIYAGTVLLIIVVVFSIFLYRRFKITERQKAIIEKQKEEVDKQRDLADSRRIIAEEQKVVIERQKHLVEAHQEEIVASITYAKRLQQAILPSDEELQRYFPGSFLIYKPKDIIAGDFYWMEHLDGITFIAAADSTGHGVPGAMVSVVCSNALNRAVKEFGLRETGKILDKTRELVLETFAKSSSEVKDGMDISLLALNKAALQIQWSGANNHLWYLENGVMKEVKPDKQPIGQTDYPAPFITHSIAYHAGTVFYLLTDGYADQFGGPGGKKYMYKRLEQELIAIGDKAPEEQKEILSRSFEDWKGKLEQIDDVTIIGLRIT